MRARVLIHAYVFFYVFRTSRGWHPKEETRTEEVQGQEQKEKVQKANAIHHTKA